VTNNPSDLDRPLWGAEAIGREAGILDDNGNVDLNRVFYQLACGHLPASKAGRLWVSTPRRIRTVFTGEASGA
jgi:hypothetical protein